MPTDTTNDPASDSDPDTTTDADGDETASSSRCGATCRDGSPCNNPPLEGSARCRMHGGASPGAPAGNQNSARHGLYADPANVLDDLAENDTEAYEWVLKKYDSYLDDAPFDDGTAKADQLKHIAVQEFIIWQATGFQLKEGVVVSTNEPEGDAFGDRIKENPVDLPLDRMQRTVTTRLKELGILDGEDDEATDSEDADKIAALRELMNKADERDDDDE